MRAPFRRCLPNFVECSLLSLYAQRTPPQAAPPAMFKRAIASTAPLCKPHAAAPAPVRRARDPLVSSPVAQHFVLESGHKFIVRPPPSVVPPTHPLPPQASTSNGGASAAAWANSPFAHISAPDAATTLLPSHSIENQHRLPSSRAARRAPATAPDYHLSSDEVERLQSLRRSDPLRWTRSALAREFGVPQHVVGRLGWGEGPEARAFERARRRQVEAERAHAEAQQGWKRTIAREERRRRRSMW